MLLSFHKAILTKRSSSGNPTDSPLKVKKVKVKKVWIWQSRGWSAFLLLGLRHFESSPVHATGSVSAKSMENPSTISNFLERTKFQKFTVLDVPYEVQIIL